jgi:hypothetical protein
MGGEVSQIGIHDTAFFYRNAKYIIWLETVWEDDRYENANRAWLRRRCPYLAAISKGSYINFPYANFPLYLAEYYGGHVCKLAKIKSKYDPFSIFSFPQSI